MKQLQKSELIDGEIYVTSNSYNDNIYEFLNKHSLDGKGCGLNLTHKNDFRSDWVLSYNNIRKTTPEEKHWLETCITANKFVSYEEAMKSFVPEYVECISLTYPNIERIHFGKIGKIYKVLNYNHSINDMKIQECDFSVGKERFKPSTKEAYDTQFVVEQPEFVLPEKWYLELKSEFAQAICDYVIKVKPHYHNEWKPINILRNKYISNNTSSGPVLSSNSIYGTEITYEQFKKYVLKETPKVTEVLEEPKDKVLKVLGTSQIIKVESSEGGIFKIGDKITPFDKDSSNKGKPFTITGFRWNNTKTEICAITELHKHNGIRLSQIELYVEPKVKIIHNFKIGDKIKIKSGHYNTRLRDLQKFKQPLFTTEDGVDIFEGDQYYSINTNLQGKIQEIFATKNTIKSCFYRYFSTKEKAEEYILLNKPVLSYNDVLNIIDTSSKLRIDLVKKTEKLVKQKLK